MLTTKINIDEWKNFLARIGRDENEVDPESFDNPNDILALRFWASYRGQTLARTGKVLSCLEVNSCPSNCLLTCLQF